MVQRAGHTIQALGAQHYQKLGILPNHRDKKGYTFRWIFNLGCMGNSTFTI